MPTKRSAQGRRVRQKRPECSPPRHWLNREAKGKDGDPVAGCHPPVSARDTACKLEVDSYPSRTWKRPASSAHTFGHHPDLPRGLILLLDNTLKARRHMWHCGCLQKQMEIFKAGESSCKAILSRTGSNLDSEGSSKPASRTFDRDLMWLRTHISARGVTRVLGARERSGMHHSSSAEMLNYTGL